MKITEVDILAIGVHPDDVEMSATATLSSHKKKGYTFGLLDLTRGELGTRGNPQLRRQEALDSMDIMGAQWRIPLDMGDGFFEINEENRKAIIRIIRQARPKIVLANTINDRHPDHGRAALLVKEACFLSGLRKVEVQDDQGKPLPIWRPQNLYYYIQDYTLEPDLIVEVSKEDILLKRRAIMAFKSQFHNPDSNEPESPLTTPYLISQLEGRCLTWGRQIGAEYGEGFKIERFIGVNDLFDLT